MTNQYEGIKEQIPNFYNLVFPKFKTFIDQEYLQANEINYLHHPAVDIESIAKKHGITDIKRVPPAEVDHKHALLKGNEILLNNQDSPENQRFSIAHELFHFITREDSDDGLQAVARQGETWKNEHSDSAVAVDEEIADYFAANLLVPTESYILWEDKTDEEIASAFNIEIRCLKKRKIEIEHELKLMTPVNLSSDVILDDTPPLSLDHLEHLLGSHNIAGQI